MMNARILCTAMTWYFILLAAWGHGAYTLEVYFVYDIILICLTFYCSIYNLLLRDPFRRHAIASAP